MLGWWHEDLGHETEPDNNWHGEHLGSLETNLINLNAIFGISDYWNLEITSTFGTRWMTWDGDSATIHHRDESTIDSMGTYVGTTAIARYLLYNDDIGAGKRIFLGLGILIPSDNTFKVNPYELSENLEPHTHFTLSDGNYRAILELQYFNRKKGLFFFGSTFRVDKSIINSKWGYRAGETFNYNGFAFLHHQKTLQYFSPYLTLSATHKFKDYWEDTGYAENSDGGYLNLGIGINRNFDNFQVNFTGNTTVSSWLTPAGDDAEQIESKMKSYYLALAVKTVIDY